MDLKLIESPSDFPSPRTALNEPNGLLGYSGYLSVDLLIAAYRKGIFPWFNDGEPVLWWSPDPRAAFFPQHTQPSRSLLKRLKKKSFRIYINRNFPKTVKMCAQPHSNRPATWITDVMIEAYQALHSHQFAHSIEVYRDDELVGGLYGISFGRLFFGESMFHRATDASKVALFYLLAICQKNEFPLVDCQLPNPHLMSLGAKEVSRDSFLRYLKTYGDSDCVKNIWDTREITDEFSFNGG